MTDPRIQYAKTSDGVNIAYAVVGEGPPLVMLGGIPQIHEFQGFSDRLAEKYTVVRGDGRGWGVSEGEPGGSLDSQVADLAAIVDHLGLEKFALWGQFLTGPIAIRYAAACPERVSRLLLFCTWASAPVAYRSPIGQAILALRNVGWQDYPETAMSLIYGLTDAETTQRMAALLRSSVTQDKWLAMVTAATEFDSVDDLSAVRTPTLILHRRQAQFPPIESARELASGIPTAKLVLLEGRSPIPEVGDVAPVLSAINQFLDEGEKTMEASLPDAPSPFRTILFTDMEGSTSLTERLGDDRAQELRRAHDTIVRAALKGCGGTETKHTGDGIMASFPSASRAIECAVAVQRAIAERDDATLRVRIGLNAGEPVVEEADLFGTAVNLARRICDRAEPGQILVSDVVHQLAAGKGFTFADNGEATLKGFEKPVRLHEVRWRD